MLALTVLGCQKRNRCFHPYVLSSGADMIDHMIPQAISGEAIPTGNGIFPRVNGYSSPSVRVVLMMSTMLDSQLLASLLAQGRMIDVEEYTADFHFGIARCRQLSPQVLIVDPQLEGDPIDHGYSLLQEQCVEHMIVLDDRIHEGRLAKLLAMRRVSYLTRQAGLEALHTATIKVATRAERVFDPTISHRIVRTPRGLRLLQHPDRPSITALTARELQVMERLARGSSVRDCAAQMHLSESTIDNHKSRLMKKLRIHKAAELTHVAIREGIISI